MLLVSQNKCRKPSYLGGSIYRDIDRSRHRFRKLFGSGTSDNQTDALTHLKQYLTVIVINCERFQKLTLIVHETGKMTA